MIKCNGGKVTNTTENQRLSGSTKNEAKKEKGKRRGCQIGCLGVILLFIGFGIFSIYMSTPQLLGDKDKVVRDIYRYHQRYGNWPKDLKELKSKLPDYKFEHRYRYLQNGEMFVVGFQGGGMIGDDYGEFYRSDTKEWKDIYTNRKEWNELEAKLLFNKNK
ncbi:hypothetical protein DRN85_10855 [Methanosarcinales archaeon]|nr:MAG: hypothetical protein DRN85_10855 [Methanosarcinales archaeon]